MDCDNIEVLEIPIIRTWSCLTESYGNLDHAFIPTASSIDLRLSNGDIASKYYWSLSLKDFLSSGILKTPFDKIYGLDSYNTPHALAEPIEDQTIKNLMNNLLVDMMNNELTPINLYLQNDLIDISDMNLVSDDLYYESKEKVFGGYNVTNEKEYGDFIIDEDGIVEIRAGKSINFRNGTHFKAGAYVHAKIEDVFLGCAGGEPTPKVSKNIPNYSFDKTEKCRIRIRPNPVKEFTNIDVILEQSNNITLTILDILGNEIHVFTENAPKSAGEHSFTFDASNLNAGMYYVNLIVNDESITKPMVIVK
jgi:hypothetical protein